MSGIHHPPDWVAEVRLRRAPDAAADARAFVEHALRGRDVPDGVLQKAKLVASELVTNAYKYGDGAVGLRLWRVGDCLRLAVSDEGSGQVPHIREQPADETGGWGLHIVDRLARQWGVFEGTTHVWADLPLES